MEVLNSYVSYMAEEYGVPITYEVVSKADIELTREVRPDGHIRIFEVSDTDSSISLDILAIERSFPYVSAASVDRPDKFMGQPMAQLGHNIYLFVPLSRIFEISITDPKELNALWVACMGNIASVLSAASTLSERMRLRKFMEALTNSSERSEIFSAMSSHRRSAEVATTDRFKSLVMAEYQAKKLGSLASSMSERRRRAQERMRGIELMVGNMIESIDFDPQGFTIVSKPATILHGERSYNFGKFKFRAVKNSNSYSYNIKGHSDNTLVRGYYHPHVSPSGVCMGNVSSDFGTALNNGDIETIIVLLVNLLNSYSSDNPFLSIENWQSDYNPFQEYVECLESADPTIDCNSCDDANCPQFATRFERCWDKILEDEAFDECIACSACDFHKQAEERV